MIMSMGLRSVMTKTSSELSYECKASIGAIQGNRKLDAATLGRAEPIINNKFKFLFEPILIFFFFSIKISTRITKTFYRTTVKVGRDLKVVVERTTLM